MKIAFRLFCLLGTVTIRNADGKYATFEVSWRHAEEDILADLRRVRADCGFHATVLVGSGCDVSDPGAFLVDCLPFGLVLERAVPSGERTAKADERQRGQLLVKVIHKLAKLFRFQEMQSILATFCDSGEVHGDHGLERLFIVWIVVDTGTPVFGRAQRANFAEPTPFRLQVSNQDALILSGM